MRIDENILISIANSSSPSTKEGFLRKKGEVNKAFVRRWFVLRKNMLFYFEKKGDTKPLGLIFLEGVNVKRSFRYGDYMFEISAEDGEGRRYYLEASSRSEVDTWLSSISEASYASMRKQYEFLREIYQQKLLVRQKEKNAAYLARVAAEYELDVTIEDDDVSTDQKLVPESSPDQSPSLQRRTTKTL